jgi:hypothetical protein
MVVSLWVSVGGIAYRKPPGAAMATVGQGLSRARAASRARKYGRFKGLGANPAVIGRVNIRH